MGEFIFLNNVWIYCLSLSRWCEVLKGASIFSFLTYICLIEGILQVHDIHSHEIEIY
jgi:hypothetical protein